ncbi:AlpA family transcriptional regulator [Hydrogenophaga sp.]|nr:AlpA family phage regulatory protein [Hydrogenophaga sp.]MDP3476571.1 AlpA family phage regulatory protein [Hydrogenophaga sp.]
MTGLGRSTIYRLMAQQQFPCPVRLGARAVACVSGGQFPRKSGVGKQSDAVIRGSQLNALNFL